MDKISDGGGKSVRFNSRSRFVTCKHACNNTLQRYSHTLVVTATLRHGSMQPARCTSYILWRNEGRLGEWEKERGGYVMLQAWGKEEEITEPRENKKQEELL